MTCISGFDDYNANGHHCVVVVGQGVECDSWQNDTIYPEINTKIQSYCVQFTDGLPFVCPFSELHSANQTCLLISAPCSSASFLCCLSCLLLTFWPRVWYACATTNSSASKVSSAGVPCCRLEFQQWKWNVISKSACRYNSYLIMPLEITYGLFSKQLTWK